MITDELRAIIVAAGITPDYASTNQVLSAINSLITSAIAGVAFNTRPGHVYTQNDWAWLDKPGGLMLQWGLSGSSTAEGPRNVTFPAAFPHACLWAGAIANNTTGLYDGNQYDYWAQVGSFGQSGAVFIINGSSLTSGLQSGAVYWFSIGF